MEVSTLSLKSRLLPLFYRVPSLSRWTALYGKPAHDGDGMAIWGRSVPFADPAFANAYIATTQFTTDRLRRMDIRWRAYVCCWAAKQALAVEGDFVECGVNTGILCFACKFCICNHMHNGNSMLF